MEPKKILQGDRDTLRRGRYQGSLGAIEVPACCSSRPGLLADGNEKYAQEFVRQADDWIDRNPSKFGVNWSCTMDVAIRVANWILRFYCFKDSKALTDEFLVKFLKSALAHGRHIMANLENRGIPNNHYLSDLEGLIYLGIVFPEFKEACRWRDFGIQELITEMKRQVYDDGMDFEASTCYHRLALELFFYPALLCRLNGIDLPQAFVDKLKKMFDFVLYVLKPNGRMPRIGDNDNGRLHVLAKRDVLDMTYLLTLATLYYIDPIYKIEEFSFESEGFWLFGPKAYERWSRLPERSVDELESRAFPDGGIYVMRHKKDYMVISCGPNGQGGLGGHAHNDKLSFELCVGGEDIIVDPGTYVYTSAPEWRNNFRSTLYHNTAIVAGAEQNELPRSNWELFRLSGSDTTFSKTWLCEATKNEFKGQHLGCINKGRGVPTIHERAIAYEKNERRWIIHDTLMKPGGRILELQMMLHFAPCTEITCQDNVVVLKSGKQKVIVNSYQGTPLELVDSWYSNQYGAKHRTKMIKCSTLESITFEIKAQEVDPCL